MFSGGIDPLYVCSALVTIAISFTLHELAHAVVAVRLGDPTPRYDGRLSLNPLRHIDPVGGMLMLVMVLMPGLGIPMAWAKPVQINPGYFKNQQDGELLVSLAGPAANFALAFLGGLPFRLGLMGGEGAFMEGARYALYIFVIMNVGLGVFNMLPLPPLDGSKVVFGLLPAEWAARWRMVERQYGSLFFMILILFIMSGKAGEVLGPVMIWVTRQATGLGMQ